MDNITHSLAGLLVAEVVVELRADRAPEDARFRSALYVTSLLANNLPDLDILYTGGIGAPLGYLLHHRGHTHTVIGSVPLSAMSVLTGWLVSKVRGHPFSRSDWM